MAPARKILIDAREFVPDRRTGIGRFLEGLVDALASLRPEIEIHLASSLVQALPPALTARPNVRPRRIPAGFLAAEKDLSRLSGSEADLYLSPYPKLPLFGARCPAVNTVHDVLDLTHPSYRNRPKGVFDRLRLRMALKRSTLTWYVSATSLEETRAHIGYAGKDPRVRPNGIEDRFFQRTGRQAEVLAPYGLRPGYILAIGNGLPHKNLGVLLGLAGALKRELVLVGATEKNEGLWKAAYPRAGARWVRFVPDEDLPAVVQAAFCLAQPSTAEGYGYPPLEAMAGGIPAVVSDIPVLKETTGGRALVADPKDPRQWLQAVESLEDRALYRSRAEEGRRWTEALRGRRGWQRHVADIEELLG